MHARRLDPAGAGREAAISAVPGGDGARSDRQRRRGEGRRRRAARERRGAEQLSRCVVEAQTVPSLDVGVEPLGVVTVAVKVSTCP